ncbi:MAG: hypothetical protein Ct9H90mP9_3110 [Pseudomonadota bacterium]|nr:MAG: hypothetical protein Ct9H90mP9_3110 [Pseudomonadota bacterium]
MECRSGSESCGFNQTFAFPCFRSDGRSWGTELIVGGKRLGTFYSMRPSEVSMLQQAELFFWVGPQFGDFSRKKPLASLTHSMISGEMIETKGASNSSG